MRVFVGLQRLKDTISYVVEAVEAEFVGVFEAQPVSNVSSKMS